MKLTCKQLYNSTQNPRINMISLDLLREYYETYLNPYIYKYEFVDCSNGRTQSKNIELRFNQENFCHLFGLESIVRKNVRNIHSYKGQLGWNNIKNGLIDFKDLKIKNKRGFLDNKTRFVFFYFLPKLLEFPKAVFFDPTKLISLTKIDCEILFYDQYQEAIVHIGIKKDLELGCYFPQTFLVKKITEENDGLKFLKDQQNFNVSKVSKELIQK